LNIPNFLRSRFANVTLLSEKQTAKEKVIGAPSLQLAYQRLTGFVVVFLKLRYQPEQVRN